MKTDDFDFFLPEQLIAVRPVEKRDGSRLLVLGRNGNMEHRIFSDLPEYLNAGDLLILNNTKVFPARLSGTKPNGGRLEILLINEQSPGIWTIMTKGKYTGFLRISDSLSAYIDKGRTAAFGRKDGLVEHCWKEGHMPLPPYIKRMPDDDDKERYQTVYASKQGSIAAPTAGLHFTYALLDTLRSKSVLIRSITLHVGVGTFRLIRTDRVEDHRMEKELFEIDPSLISEIKKVKERGNRVIAAGTTTTRALEGYLSGQCSIVESNGVIRGFTDIFIHEGYSLHAVDSLITNFHLPRSSPIMLASRFAGRERLLTAYSTAISMGYRFFSYGDAMLVL